MSSDLQSFGRIEDIRISVAVGCPFLHKGVFGLRIRWMGYDHSWILGYGYPCYLFGWRDGTSHFSIWLDG